MYTSSRTQSGFTLIEILVVVAIIGILSAIVYASFNDARKNARDKAIKAEVETLRLEARLYYERYNNFATGNARDNDITNCSGGISVSTLFGTSNDGSLSSLVRKIHETSSRNNNARVYCGANANSWAFAAPLSDTVSANNVTAWCVDSSGASREVTFTTSNPGGYYLFSGPTYSCPSS